MKKSREPTPEEMTRLAPTAALALAELQASLATGEVVDVRVILRHHPRPDGGMFSKGLLLRIYHFLLAKGEIAEDKAIPGALLVKPVRTISGVAPVTVLTRPGECPGECVFCPDEPGLPKSYLANEPGAMRALQADFDPFAQVRSRLDTLAANGHHTDKIELLILGGSWSSYPADYQDWFLRRCFAAMNGQESATLAEARNLNAHAVHRNVGLVLETRPDLLTRLEVGRLRQLGATKIQLGAQSLDDEVRRRSCCGGGAEEVRQAVTNLRSAAFKIVLHWMPNLVGATPESDLADFARLWDDPALRPDELKIYPCSLVGTSRLMDLWKSGDWQPYGDEELLELVTRCKLLVPSYCRINRVFRDIPATEIVAGCRRANLRQLAHLRLQEWGKKCQCIRCREVRGAAVQLTGVELREDVYATRVGEEHFLSFVDSHEQLAGYLRLCLPGPDHDPPCLEIRQRALIREIHIYGQALPMGGRQTEAAQHHGLGGRLLARARVIARENGYGHLAVIHAAGTREYYRERGFEVDGVYMAARL